MNLLGLGQAPLTDQSCPVNQIIDAGTGQCANLCPDYSRPVNGACIGYSGGYPYSPKTGGLIGGMSTTEIVGIVAGALLLGLGGYYFLVAKPKEEQASKHAAMIGLGQAYASNPRRRSRRRSHR